MEDIIGRIMAGIRGLARRRVPVEIRAPDMGPLALALTVKAAAVKLREAPGGLVVRGERSRRGRVELVVEEEPGAGRIARLLVEAASVEVSGPIKQLEVKASAGAVRAGPMGPLEGLALEAVSSSLRVTASLAVGAPVSIKARAAGVRLELSPGGAGDYPVELEASNSAVKVEAPVDYIVEESRVRRASVKVAEGRGSRARFRVRVRASYSSISLL